VKVLRIGVLVDRITPGATPKFLGNEVRHLRDMGHDAEAISIVDTGLSGDGYQFHEFLDGVPVRYMSQEHILFRKTDFKIPPFSFFAGFDVAAMLMMGRYIKRDANPYDVIIAHTSISSFIANRIQRATGIPYVAVMWDTISFILGDVYKSRTLLKPMMPLLSRVARAVDRQIIDEALVCVTGSIPHLRLIEHFTGRTADVVYPGVDVAENLPAQRGDYLFTIDRWDVGNLPTWLLDVVASLSVKINFKIAGFWWPTGLREEFEQIIRDRGLDGQVEVLGPVSEERLTALFRGARAMIYPHNAGIVFGVMEAAAQGCPVMMQESTDLFTDGVNGFFPSAGISDERGRSKWDTHRPIDLTQFIKCTEVLATDERRAWEMGKNAWELMKDYSWRTRAERLVALIKAQMDDQSLREAKSNASRPSGTGNG
jgi:glycosyltransferase involved in cell wall biosynthesis